MWSSSLLTRAESGFLGNLRGLGLFSALDPRDRSGLSQFLSCWEAGVRGLSGLGEPQRFCSPWRCLGPLQSHVERQRGRGPSPGWVFGGRCDHDHASKAKTSGEQTKPVPSGGWQLAQALGQDALWTVVLEMRRPLEFFCPAYLSGLLLWWGAGSLLAALGARLTAEDW